VAGFVTSDGPSAGPHVLTIASHEPEGREGGGETREAPGLVQIKESEGETKSEGHENGGEDLSKGPRMRCCHDTSRISEERELGKGQGSVGRGKKTSAHWEADTADPPSDGRSRYAHLGSSAACIASFVAPPLQRQRQYDDVFDRLLQSRVIAYQYVCSSSETTDSLSLSLLKFKPRGPSDSDAQRAHLSTGTKGSFQE
jgi:hypothetical protein